MSDILSPAEEEELAHAIRSGSAHLHKPQCTCSFFQLCRQRRREPSSVDTPEKAKNYVREQELKRLLRRKAEKAEAAHRKAKNDHLWRVITDSDLDRLDRAIKSGDFLTIKTSIGNGVLSTNQLILRLLQFWIESGYQGAVLEFLRGCWPDLPKDPSNFDREDMDQQVESEIPRVIVGEQDFKDWDHIHEFMECYK